MAITKKTTTQMRAIIVGLRPEDCGMELLVAPAVALGFYAVSMFCYESILGRLTVVGSGILIAIA
jgi:hypothetical protein